MPELSDDELDALVEEATVDAYGDDEQLGGFAVMITKCLKEMPGHQAYLDFAIEVGAELPSRARETAVGRAAGEHAPTGSGCLVRTSPGRSPGDAQLPRPG